MENKINLNRYYKEVEKALKCSSKAKKEILNNMRSDIEDYIAEHPAATESEIRLKFGEPQQYADEFLVSLDKKELGRKVWLSRIGLKFWIISALIMILLLALTIIGIIIRNERTKPEYYSEEIVYNITQN